MNLHDLRAPFPTVDIEWRIGRAGKKGDKIWATCLAYLTNRAIMDRLDEVVGPEGWQNEFRQGPTGGILCGIGILIDGQWVWKWDGADNTDIEAVKGGISSSMKRTAVQWGIGRYLYRLEEGFANVHPQGRFRGQLSERDGKDRFRWDPPPLPLWALPDVPPEPGAGKVSGAPPKPDTGEEATEKQLKFLSNLLGSSALDPDQVERVRARMREGMTKQQCSDAIEWVQEQIGKRDEQA